MTISNGLPDKIAAFIQCSQIAEYVTISAAGDPVDTPVLFFPSEGLRTLDLATGLSYPAKAERARRNPKVGMLIEGGPNDPVVAVAGMAAVRDSNLQANVDRYLREAYMLPGNPDWALARQAVWYWTRIMIEVTPARILWWQNPVAMDGPPQQWVAPAGMTYPTSDPAPPGKPSEPAKWNQPPWQELAQRALARGGNGHLSFIDGDGFPLPVRARKIAATETGFALELPKGLPWPVAGKACLTFSGIETFIGSVTMRDGAAAMQVARALPVFPMTNDTRELWEPAPHTRASLMARLKHETARRSLPVPTIPVDRPAPSEGYLRRTARAAGSSVN